MKRGELFGTVGSAVLLALVGPKLLAIDLVAACKAHEARQGGAAAQGIRLFLWGIVAPRCP